jgi:O-acetyl-ADP-ribose deacetylase (regulator of RNase III)
MLAEFLNGRLIVTVGDLTEENTDAIVNAANSSLLGGGGVDGAIHKKGGPQILLECRRLRETEYPDGLPTGEAVVTTGGLLPAKYVIHTVGPVYGRNAGRDSELLANAYLSSFARAEELELSSIAFPSISTGVYGFPKPEAAPVVSTALTSALSGARTVKDVRLVFHNQNDAEVFLRYCRF